MITELGKHASLVLDFILERGEIKKTELKTIISNPQTYGRIVSKLEAKGFILVKETVMGRRVVLISLTPKGRAVAEQLKRTEQISQGKHFSFPDKFAIISYLSDSGPQRLSQLRERYPDAADIIREFESLKVVRQEIDKSKFPQVNYIVLTEKGEEIAKKLQEIDEILKKEVK
jgi:DNA-binding MarR family transcriptional regulator